MKKKIFMLMTVLFAAVAGGLIGLQIWVISMALWNPIIAGIVIGAFVGLDMGVIMLVMTMDHEGFPPIPEDGTDVPIPEGVYIRRKEEE